MKRDIDNKIKQFENQFVEWKENWHNDYLKWINGYANAQGGILYIGYNDNGDIVGLNDKTIKDLLVNLPNTIANKMNIVVQVNLVQEDKGQIIEIVVDKYDSMILLDGRAYLRSGSVKREFTDKEYEKYYLQRLGLTWDSVSCENVSIDDLDKEAIDLFRENAIKSQRMKPEQVNIPDEMLLRKIGAINSQGYITRAGVIAFHEDPELILPGNYFMIARCGDNGDISYHDNSSGALIKQIDEITDLAYSKYLLGLDGVEEKMINVKHYIVYRDSFRELLLNSCIHKEISSSIPVKIKVWKDKVTISNKGEMPPTLRDDKRLYSEHQSYPVNPALARIFYLAGLIETWGSSFNKIKNDCKKNNALLPAYSYDDPFVVMTCLPTKRYLELLNNVYPEIHERNEIDFRKLNREEQFALILKYCETPKTAKEIRSHFGYNDSSYFKKTFLNSLISDNKLFEKYPNNKNRFDQMYCSDKNELN